MVGAANPTFFRSPLNQRGTKKTWIWQGEKIGGGLDESGAQNQRTRSCLTTCYQQRRETYAGRCVTNRGERRGDCSEIYLHSLPFGALILLGTALGCKIGGDGLVVTKIEGGLDGRTRRRRGRRTQTKATGGPADDRRTGAQTETRTDREVDGQTEAQGADHVS